MRIRQLTLKSFGKFQNTTLNLQDGINVIDGSNEAGKTTVHQMIESMFYGFYKPNIKNRKLSESYDQYLPWQNANEFSAIMVLEDEGQVRIERSFMKNKDEVLIFDGKSGQELTQTYPYDPVSRQYQPGLKHLGMSLSTYRNTVSIAQMQNKTTAELVLAIKENVINLGQTRTLDVSLDNVYKQLQERRSAIGTARGKKSQMGKTMEAIARLEEERDRLQISWAEIAELRKQEDAWIKKITTLEQVKSALEVQMDQLRSAQEEMQRRQLDEIAEQLAALKAKVEKLTYTRVADKSQVQSAILGLARLEGNEKEGLMLKERLDGIKERLAIIDLENGLIAAQLTEIGIADRMTQEISLYEELETQIKDENEKNHLGEIETARSVMKAFRVKNIRTTVFLIPAVLILLAGAGGFGLEYFMLLPSTAAPAVPYLPIAAGVGLLATIGLALLKGAQRRHFLEAETQLAQAVTKQDAHQTRKGDLLAKQLHVLKQYDCLDVKSLKTMRDEQLKAEMLSQANEKRMEALAQEALRLQQDLQKDEAYFSSLSLQNERDKQEIGRVMDALAAENEDDLKRCLNDMDELEIAEGEIRGKQALYEAIASRREYGFETQSADALSDKSAESGEFNDEPLSFEDINRKHRQVLSQLLVETRHYNQLCGEINSKESRLKPLTMVEEALAEQNREVEQLNYRLDVLDLIEEGITSVAEQIHDNFAPDLNEKVSRLVSTVTDYKYADIKITTDLNMTVLDQENHKFVPVENLSAGTLDLMYLALRMALSELVSPGRDLPILLDDSFVQYDDRRLVKALEVLAKTGRQVILFTCHKRELAMLERMQARPHIVHL